MVVSTTIKVLAKMIRELGYKTSYDSFSDPFASCDKSKSAMIYVPDKRLRIHIENGTHVVAKYAVPSLENVNKLDSRTYFDLDLNDPTSLIQFVHHIQAFKHPVFRCSDDL